MKQIIKTKAAHEAATKPATKLEKTATSQSKKLNFLLIIPKTSKDFKTLMRVADMAMLIFDDIDNEGISEVSKPIRVRSFSKNGSRMILPVKQQFIVVSVYSDLKGMDKVLESAAYTRREQLALSRCTLCVPPRNLELNDYCTAVTSTAILHELQRHPGLSAEQFDNLLLQEVLKYDAATKYYFSQFFEEHEEFESALKLMAEAAKDNYSRAVKFLGKLLDMFESEEEVCHE